MILPSNDTEPSLAATSLRERVVWRLLSGVFVADDDSEAVDLWSAGWSEWAWRVATLELSSGAADVSAAPRMLVTLLENAVIGPLDWNADRRCIQVAVIFHDRIEERLRRRTPLHGTLEALQRGGLRVVAGVGSVVSGYRDLRRSFQEARLAATYGWVRGEGLYCYDGGREAAGLGCPDGEAYPARFNNLLSRGGDGADLIAEYLTVLRTVAARRLPQEIQKVFSQVADLIQPSADLDWAYHVVDFIQGPEDLVRQLTALCQAAASAVVQRGDGLADRKAREFKEFVEGRVEDWSLSLAAAADALQISSSYLAKILKSRLATTFVDYVTERRLARAQELLVGTNLMTSAIAEQVGFGSTPYFSSCFKKRVGVTPSEYRVQGRSKTAISA